MSIAAIAAGPSHLCSIQSQYQQVHKQFKPFGQALQGGALTKAQSDSVTLSQAASSEAGSGGLIAQALSKVGTALQSGDLASAQQAFSLVAKVGANAVSHHANVPPMVGKLTQRLEQLGQALQAGDLSAAQQALATVQQLWKQMSGAGLTTPSSAMPPTSTTGIST
jgi:hypothetical protein